MSKQSYELRLARQVFETETRVSKITADHLPVDIRNAVLSAMRVAIFYEKNPTDMIMPRDITQILRQMDSQVVFTFELVHESDAQLVASCILWDKEWPVVQPDGSIEIAKFLETGTQQCILNGLNLQWTLNSFTLLRSLLHDASGTYFAATYGDNKPSIDNFKDNMKFSEWTTVPSTLERWRMFHLEEHNEQHRDVRWFRPTVDSVIAAAERVIDFAEKPKKMRKKRKARRAQVDRFSHVGSVELICEQKVLEPILEAAREISAAQPKSTSDLAKILVNPLISDTFLKADG